MGNTHPTAIIDALRRTALKDLFPNDHPNNSALAEFDESQAQEFIASKGKTPLNTFFKREESTIEIIIYQENNNFGFKLLGPFIPVKIEYRDSDIDSTILKADKQD